MSTQSDESGQQSDAEIGRPRLLQLLGHSAHAAERPALPLIDDAHQRQKNVVRPCLGISLREGYSIFAPDCWITFFHFSVSRVMRAASTSGVSTVGITPMPISRSRISGKRSTTAMSRFSRSTIGRGVPLRAVR